MLDRYGPGAGLDSTAAAAETPGAHYEDPFQDLVDVRCAPRSWVSVRAQLPCVREPGSLELRRTLRVSQWMSATMQSRDDVRAAILPSAPLSLFLLPLVTHLAVHPSERPVSAPLRFDRATWRATQPLPGLCLPTLLGWARSMRISSKRSAMDSRRTCSSSKSCTSCFTRRSRSVSARSSTSTSACSACELPAPFGGMLCVDPWLR